MKGSIADPVEAPVRTLLLVLGALALVVLVLTTSIPPRTTFLARLNNAGHALIFGALALPVLRLVVGRRPAARPRDYLTTFVAVLLAGTVVEFVQHFTGRDASAGDVLMDAAGASFVLCGLALWARPAPGKGRLTAPRGLLVVGMLVSASVVVAPLAESALAYQRRAAIFPDLLRFDRPIDRYFLLDRGIQSRVEPLPAPWHGADDAPALRAELTRARGPGLQLFEPAPDWRGYSALKIDLVNPGDTSLRLVVRVHDAAHDQRHEDRFNRAFILAAASRRVLEIPLADIENAPRDRPLDLSRVAAIGLFEGSRPAPPGAAFYLARIWLE